MLLFITVLNRVVQSEGSLHTRRAVYTPVIDNLCVADVFYTVEIDFSLRA